MSRRGQRKKQQILAAVRRKAGMPGFGRVDLIRVVCERLNVSMPESWDRRYALMREWASDYLPARKSIQPPPPPVAIAAPPLKKKIKKKVLERVATDAFLLSTEWRQLRMRVLVARGARCECCGATPQDGVRMNVDHVKPRKFYPELALDEANLQVLCEVCNHGKGNWDQTDWRTPRLVKGNTA